MIYKLFDSILTKTLILNIIRKKSIKRNKLLDVNYKIPKYNIYNKGVFNNITNKKLRILHQYFVF